jgi:hypothetical protein
MAEVKEIKKPEANAIDFNALSKSQQFKNKSDKNHTSPTANKGAHNQEVMSSIFSQNLNLTKHFL